MEVTLTWIRCSVDPVLGLASRVIRSDASPLLTAASFTVTVASRLLVVAVTRTPVMSGSTTAS